MWLTPLEIGNNIPNFENIFELKFVFFLSLTHYNYIEI